MDIFEILVPLIFAAIYFFGNMFAKKSEDEGAAGGGASPRTEEDGEGARQRRIQEAIRRKIMERRQAEPEAAGQPLASESVREPVRRDESKADRRLRERRVAAGQLRERSLAETRMPELRPEEPEPLFRPVDAEEITIPPPVLTARESRSRPSEGSFSWNTSDDVYGNELQARLKKIEATKRQAEALKRQAEARRSPHTMQPAYAASKKGALFQGSVIENLRSPGAARAAFIYGEVLGPPVSQRRSQSIPGLER